MDRAKAAAGRKVVWPIVGNSKSILTTRNLCVGYGRGSKEKIVLRDMDLDLRQGRLVCFMGPNGAGKSTLIRTLCRAQRALAGTLSVAGKDINDYTFKAFSKMVSVVYADATDAGGLSVEQLVAFGRYPHTGWSFSLTKADTRFVDKAIASTNIGMLRKAKLYELSDGQLQKVMIARALCQDTPLMVLDEPTVHLDLNNRVEIINLLRTITREANKTVLMATHELDLALQAADRIWLASPSRKSVIDGFPEDLVLNGKIDEVFDLKGFDLKTGYLTKKVNGTAVRLTGSGYARLWTKNAMERHGFRVSENAAIAVRINNDNDRLGWSIKAGEYYEEASTLEELMAIINRI